MIIVTSPFYGYHVVTLIWPLTYLKIKFVAAGGHSVHTSVCQSEWKTFTIFDFELEIVAVSHFTLQCFVKFQEWARHDLWKFNLSIFLYIGDNIKNHWRPEEAEVGFSEDCSTDELQAWGRALGSGNTHGKGEFLTHFSRTFSWFLKSYMLCLCYEIKEYFHFLNYCYCTCRSYRARATRGLGRHSRLREADFALCIVGGEVKVALLYQKSLC